MAMVDILARAIYVASSFCVCFSGGFVSDVSAAV